MQILSLNPGFALIVGALLAFASPRPMRGAIMILAPIAALALILWRPFGEYRGFSQIGLEIIRFRIDDLSLIFGLSFAISAILIGVASGARNQRNEDAAILAMAGAACTAAFSGDLITFVAASELSALAGFWIILAAGGRTAFDAGLRFMIWQGLGGLLLLCGVAFHLADGFDSGFARMPGDSLGGGFFLAGLLIKAAGPFVHVWFKEAAAQASPTGAMAITAFSVTLALYALARGFAGEDLLAMIGPAAALIGALYALAEDNIRRALGYSFISQSGLMLTAIGTDLPENSGAATPLAGASAHALTMAVSYALIFAALGVIERRAGSARMSRLREVGAAAPLAATLGLIGAFSAAGVPGFAGFVSESLTREAIAGDGLWRSVLLLAAAAATIGFCLVRLPLALFGGNRSETAPAPDGEPFRLYLAMGLAAFLCLAVGLAPGWIIGLSPGGETTFEALAPGRIATRLEFIGAAACGAGAAASIGLLAIRKPRTIFDIDTFYEGPAAKSARWTGSTLLAAYERLRASVDAAISRLGEGIAQGSRTFDRPYVEAGVLQSVSLGLVLCLVVVLYLFST